MPKYGYHGKILHVDLTRQTTRIEEPDDNFYRLYGGGGLLATTYLLKETPSGIDPLSPDNLLIFASSVLCGYPAAGLPYYTVSAKSPLTGGIGETRAEGAWGVALKKSGYDAIVVHGAADAPVGLLIADGAVSFFDAGDLWGRNVGETTDALESRFGAGIDVAAIGQAGENRVRFSSIVSNRTHQAKRMGMGAVMGAKKLKVVVLRGGQPPPMAQPEVVARLTADYADGINGNDLTRWQKEPPGWMAWIHLLADASLDVENYRKSQLAGVEAYAADEFMKFYKGHSACPGCPNDCLKILHDDEAADLDARAGGSHQEFTGTLGANLGMTDLRAVIRANNLANQWGMDVVSLGFTLSMAMELMDAGILTEQDTDGVNLRFGDADAMLDMMRKITFREGFGDVLAEGSQRAAAKIGKGAERYALHVKGLEMVSFEPRAQTNLALGFAVAPIGPRYDICEHDWDYDTSAGWSHTLDRSRTLGILERIPMEYLGADKVRNFKALSTLWSGCDTLGICNFASAPTRLLNVDIMVDMLAAVTGWDTSSYEIMRYGERRFHLMRVYNLREGLTAADDWLPDRFFDEPIQSGPKAGVKLDREKFRAAIQTYYEMMGWDENGAPRRATLYDHHLEWTL